MVNSIISVIVNVFRSIPFIILIVLLIPFTKILVGTMLGANAALPALIIGAAPFYARMVEIALREIDRGVIEASQSMGANNGHIIRCKHLLFFYFLNYPTNIFTKPSVRDYYI